MVAKHPHSSGCEVQEPNAWVHTRGPGGMRPLSEPVIAVHIAGSVVSFFLTPAHSATLGAVDPASNSLAAGGHSCSSLRAAGGVCEPVSHDNLFHCTGRLVVGQGTQALVPLVKECMISFGCVTNSQTSGPSSRDACVREDIVCFILVGVSEHYLVLQY